MCNSRHPDSITPKRKNGKAYKLFNIKDGCPFLAFNSYPYEFSEDGFAYWKEAYGEGFACIPTKREAFRLLKMLHRYDDYWKKSTRIFSISYKDALARHMENNILSGYTFDTLLVKAFKPIERIYAEI